VGELAAWEEEVVVVRTNQINRNVKEIPSALPCW